MIFLTYILALLVGIFIGVILTFFIEIEEIDEQ